MRLTRCGILLAIAAATAHAEVTTFQNGVKPTPAYAGCQDTWISGEKWEQGRDYGQRPTLRCGGQRHILIRFDLGAIPKGHVVHRAVLDLADVGYPRQRQGKWPVTMLARRLTRAWQDDANWLEHTRTDYKAEDAGDWATPGGELDRETDFGRDERGLIASDTTGFDGRAHLHRLDVTRVVQAWHGGTLPNHGIALAAPPKSHGCQVASSEWNVPDCRPRLIVAHGPKGRRPAPIRPLPSVPEAIELLSAPAGVIKPRGDYAVTRVGQNDNCTLRGASTDAYVKEAALRYPG
ncbi:MAG: DNRLRE domain-containing protein, partial [Planctomycetota bacterium]